MTLADAIAHDIDLNHAMGLRFHVDEAILKAFHRHAGAVDVAAVSSDIVGAFLQPRHRVTSTWHMKHRALRRFYQYGITQGIVAHSPVPRTVPRVTETFVPRIYSHEELRGCWRASPYIRPGRAAPSTFNIRCPTEENRCSFR